jgi:DNA-binding PadR family transcriptional regulator
MSSLTTRGALLQALREGAGFGAELIRRLERLSSGSLCLSPARVYPVLQQLEKEGLVVGSAVIPKGRRGARRRTYYDLTLRGVEESMRERERLLALLSPPTIEISPDERRRMAYRVIQMDELSTSGEELRMAMGGRRR